MITRSALSVHTIEHFNSWQDELANAISCPEQLLSLLGLDNRLLPDALRASRTFTLRVPHGFVRRMDRGNPDDPLLRQVLPLGKECVEVDGYTLDPLAEQSQNPCDGVIHKYQGRLLLIVSGACAVNCRFCFRRHFPYEDNQLSSESWQKAIDYIASDNSIHEVILSGGDPLAANDRRLAKMTAALNDIEHVKTLRIHTRLPIMIPERVTDAMVQWFAHQRLKPVMVIHCNHPNELDNNVRTGLHKLRLAGVTLLNQSVLLQGVNDDVNTLTELNSELFQVGVLPYYLHLLDPVQGAAHFDVPEHKALQLMSDLKARCSGYLVPRLVREIAGEPGKTWIH
ncbi:EF-P beta-lysylation protein EpmB [Endozoicomonas sp. (ex Bugula neritina AB1)]|nr:EF-P beta-lysylation protein EpmB [Endozoicomonas sp. (ex Bugula neritina AB1)]